MTTTATRIPNLPSATAVTGSDYLIVYQGGVTKKVQADALPSSTAAAWATLTGKPTTVGGFGITDAYTKTETDTLLLGKQPTDADLTAIAALVGTTGLLKKTAANTWTLDTSTYVTSSGVTAVSGTAPIVSSGGATPAISISAATSGAAGSMSAADKSKLDGIASGAQVNVATNIAEGTRTTTGVPITSSTGTSATLSPATTLLAGVMSAADKSKLDGIASGATAYTHPASHPASIITQDASNRFVTDTEKSTWNAKQAALGFTPENSANKGAANGYAGLDGTGKVPSAQLPSFVDDVLEYANLAAFPGTGAAGTIYVTLDTNKTYRWSGSAYVEISPSPGSTDSVTEGSTNLYFTAQRVRDSVLTGLSTATNAAIAAADTVLGAFGKIQAQITAHFGSGGTAHANAVSSGAAGFMTGADKAKLDGIATSANNYTHPTSDGNLHVPVTGTTNNGKVLMAGATAGNFGWAAIPTLNQNTTGTAANVTGIVALVNGGTGATTAAAARTNLGAAESVQQAGSAFDFNNYRPGTPGLLRVVWNSGDTSMVNAPNGNTTGFLVASQGSHDLWNAQLFMEQGSTGSVWSRGSTDGGGTRVWGAWRKQLDSSNYNSYSPTLTGTGASGTWSINVTGNAATVTNGVYTNTAQTITGVKTFSNGIIVGDTQGYPDYSVLLDFGADVTGTWRKLVTATLVDGIYSTIGFKVDVVDPRANHAVSGSIHARTETYYIACLRSEGLTLNTPDACYVSGPSNRIRAVKTALGVYEIQIQNEAQWWECRVDICVYAVNNAHNIVYHPGAACTAGTAQYNASVSATQTDFFQNVSARTVKSSVATGTAPLEVLSTTVVTNLNADLLDGQHGSYYQNAGNLNAGTIPDARLPTRLSTTGANIADWNAAITSGYYMGAGATNAPTATIWYIGQVIAHNATWVTQTVYAFADNSEGTNTMTWRREMNNGTWTAWVRIWQTEGELDARYVRLGVYNFLNNGIGTTYGLPASTSMLTRTNTVAGFEVQAQGTGATAGAALMTFHRPSAHAAFFGLDTDNNWKVGGWSMGAVAYRLWHEGNDGTGSGLDADLLDGTHKDTLEACLRANTAISGGGTISVSASSEVRWTNRFIVVSNGTGSHFSTSGYFDIGMPGAGTVVTGVGGAANATVTASGVPLTAWQALYYILPISGYSTFNAANLRVAVYTTALTIPHNWVLLCVVNGDSSTWRFHSGLVLRAGESVTTGTSTSSDDRNRRITVSSSAPSGGADGDVWLLYTA